SRLATAQDVVVSPLQKYRRRRLTELAEAIEEAIKTTMANRPRTPTTTTPIMTVCCVSADMSANRCVVVSEPPDPPVVELELLLPLPPEFGIAEAICRLWPHRSTS